MKSKFILSSAFIMTTMGAFGADAKITEASTCTVDVLGVSDNNAVANTIATWDAIEYTLNPGQYLNVTETSVDKTICPSGSYCVGGGYTVETADNSIAQCPAEYPNSAEGAGADTQCYTACTVATANIAHATAVAGNDYYGTGVDTCEPTACVAGWHIKPGLNLKDTIGEEAGTNSAYIGVSIINLDSSYTISDGSFYESNYDDLGEKGQEYYGITDNMSFAVEYGKLGMITGTARVSTLSGDNNNDTYTNPTIIETLADEIGSKDAVYCYCRVDTYTPFGGIKQKISSKWVYNSMLGANNCPHTCSFMMRDNDESRLAFRTAVLNTVPALPATCEANTINIDWNPDNNGAHIKNMCTYEGSIEFPTPDPVKPGYTFTGWKLVE